MTIEEKAKELVEKYAEVNRLYVLYGAANQADILDEAKACALIAIDEILDALYGSQLELELDSDEEAIAWFEKIKSQIIHYKAVKKAIEAL